MSFDPTVTWQSVATFAAVLSSWMIPLAIGCISRKKNRDLAQRSVVLYLDTLQVKVRVAKDDYFQPGGRLPTGLRSFEATNRANFQALEELFRTQELSHGQKHVLFDLITYIKITPIMLTEDDFESMAQKLESDDLRRFFPSQGDIERSIREAIDSHRKNRRHRVERKGTPPRRTR